MNQQDLLETFSQGALRLPHHHKEFSDIEWSPHPAFEGVALKHLITAEDTQGQFSYHLVRIAPHKSIKIHHHDLQLETHEVVAGSGVCVHDGVTVHYEPGIISIFQQKVKHEVNADADGLYLFAKFFPALY